MTALNCFVTPEAVNISTDGAGYLMDGTPRGQGQKVALLAHLPAVIAVRGASAFVHMLGASISAHFLAFDDLLPEAPALFRGVRRQYRREMELRGLADIAPREAEFVIAGFSTARDRVEAYGMHSKAWNGGEPWALVPISEGALSPVDDQVMADFDAIVDRIGDPRLMPEAAAVQIMESQRSRPFVLEDGKKVVGVGGFCQLTTLTRAGITSRILKRWLGAVAV
ncbi:hypothetical protein MKK68_24615 [Methylobacterium sp. E-016]|uniref:hypothetical protein n=1 Tax=Methylobacterium sp. E-016 TaxID=2836556 RepID=UPI001FBAD0F9|nr:hypothetical protein [Methylobacterium sp. E-016]MCJ2078785.1 hypothetical protein [Methylobacterium sp. E-016]